MLAVPPGLLGRPAIAVVASPVSLGAAAKRSSAAHAAPRLAAGATSESEICLTWNNVAKERGYRVFRLDDETGSWTQIGTTAANKTQFRVSGLSAGTSHTFRVAAFNARGARNSNSVDATTLGVPNAAPPLLTVTAVSQSTISLAWNDVAGETGGSASSGPTDSKQPAPHPHRHPTGSPLHQQIARRPAERPTTARTKPIMLFSGGHNLAAPTMSPR